MLLSCKHFPQEELRIYVIMKYMVELVELTQVSPKILLDIRYATPNNFTGKPVYASARCFLLRKTAERLHRVQNNLEKIGLGLKVFDGYRSPAAQKIFWSLVPDLRYVADPKVGSRHSRGASVDLTLVKEDGSNMLMPTDFDDFTKKASRRYLGPFFENRDLLEREMKAEGFIPWEHEWWHYDDPDWESCPILDFNPPR